ncbi:MAG: hypothetical protein HY743_02255 [Deltaproteobacteria bacterium]|nr:hypothetical protein [Deltaproteobacteria bacterium]
MKKKMLIICLCFMAWIFLAGGSAFGITLNYSSIPDASITFYGTSKTFEFPDSGNDFQIVNVAGGSEALGLYGNIDGTFTIGAITTTPLGFGTTFQYAKVSGEGTFEIDDESGFFLNGNLQWIDIYTVGNNISTTGALNTLGVINITDITYEGENADLLLFANSNAAGNLTFQFLFPGLSLTQLTEDGAENPTSYSGSVSSIPVPPTALLLGSGILGLVAWGWRRGRKED